MKCYHMHREKSVGAVGAVLPARMSRFGAPILPCWVAAALLLGCTVCRSNADVAYTDILLAPEEFVGRNVTMRGGFSYKNTERKSFDLKQGDQTVEVFYELLPVQKQALILKQRNFSGVTVALTGKVQRYSNAVNSYYIMAADVVILGTQPAQPMRTFPTAPTVRKPAPSRVSRSSDLEESRKMDMNTQAAVFSLVCLVALLTTIWVAFDAQANKITSRNGPYTLRNGALTWVAACVLLWVVAFPYYLVRRSAALRERGGNLPPLGLPPVVPTPVLAATPAGRDQETTETSKATARPGVVLKPGKTWYYVERDKSVGPMEEAYLHVLVKGGQLDKHRTLVWQEGLESWRFYDDLFSNKGMSRRSLPAKVPPLPVPPSSAAARGSSEPEPPRPDTGGVTGHPRFVRGTCQHCGGHLEFSSLNAGQTIDCPLCRERTRLEQNLEISSEHREAAAKSLPVGIPVGRPRT